MIQTAAKLYALGFLDGTGITLLLSASESVPDCWIFFPWLLGFGGKGIRTPDFQLAKLALYQLSYAPEKELPNLEWRFSIARELKAKCRTSSLPGIRHCSWYA